MSKITKICIMAMGLACASLATVLCFVSVADIAWPLAVLVCSSGVTSFFAFQEFKPRAPFPGIPAELAEVANTGGPVVQEPTTKIDDPAIEAHEDSILTSSESEELET